jgi:hypothetical protein|tara:strand:+ start:1091 stop:2287 length:1197 start_codon:yes stop_codon:yes gene_type:complete
MAQCITYDLICPIGADGGKCTFVMLCCDGTERYIYTIDEETTEQVCLGSPYNIYTSSIDGTFNSTGVVCSTNCGAADPVPTPSPVAPTPAAPTPAPAAPTPGPSPTPAAPTPVAPSPIPAPSSIVPPIPSPVDTEYTLSYSQGSKGWPSFYSYIPDFMLGMNNFFYTFKNGNVYQHNANEARNNFYGVQYSAQISSVFNEMPLENKIFKSFNLESDNAWQMNFRTDIQSEGLIQSSWFEKKEGSYFAFVRQTGEVPAEQQQYAMRSANGIGKAASNSLVGSTGTVNFSVNPLVSIGSILSIGDYLYFSVPSYTTIQLAGQVTNIEVDLPNSVNRITYTNTTTGSQPILITDPYILYIKSSEAESHGLLGHYCLFTLINESSVATELFAVESDIMKSYP